MSGRFSEMDIKSLFQITFFLLENKKSLK